MRRRDLLAAFCYAATRAKAAERPFECIDTHTHMHRGAPALIAAMQQANWRCLSICDSREIGDQPSILNEMISGTKALHAESHGRIAWATTFDAPPYRKSGFGRPSNRPARTRLQTRCGWREDLEERRTDGERFR